MSRIPVRPYLVTKSEDARYRITVRTTRFNSQGYPLVSSEVLDDSFRTQKAAKAYVRQEFNAEPSDIAIK
jgi:hypothetical protein